MEGNHIGGGSDLISKAQTSAPAALLSFSIIVAFIFSMKDMGHVAYRVSRGLGLEVAICTQGAYE